MGGIVNALPITTLETIEHLDFDHKPPCEHAFHHGAQAAIFVIRFNPHCDRVPRTFLVCLACWERVGVVGLFCVTCHADRDRDDAWTIIRVIGDVS
jgi:hypothetical protein